MKGLVEILEYSNQRFACIDIYSKMLQNRIIFVNEEFNADTVSEWQAQLLYLASISKEGDTIQMYINSPGGEVYSCLGLYDVMQSVIKRGINISTINIGLAASAASIILMSGSKGMRKSLPNATVLLHQPSGVSFGTVTDMEISTEESKRLKNVLSEIVKTHALEELVPLMERDYFLNAEEALKYNIIDALA